MTQLFRPPSPALAPFVSGLWWYESEQLSHARERLMPGTRVQLLINLHEDRLRFWDGPGLEQEHRLRGALVSGVYDRPFAIETRDQRRLVGAVLRPGAVPALMGVPGHLLASQHVELDVLWKTHNLSLRERLLACASPEACLQELDRALCERLRTTPDAAILYAVAQLERGASVVGLAEELGYSPKRLRKQFNETVGVMPKCYARLARLQRLLSAANSRSSASWSQLATDVGYYDQAHMISEFRSLTGLTPNAYHPRSADEGNHVVLAD